MEAVKTQRSKGQEDPHNSNGGTRWVSWQDPFDSKGLEADDADSPVSTDSGDALIPRRRRSWRGRQELLDSRCVSMDGKSLPSSSRGLRISAHQGPTTNTPIITAR